MKEYLLSVDYCAFMVAIFLARHEVNKNNTDKQWSAVEISQELNNLPYAATANFRIDSDALQHGMNIFQRQFRNRGILAVTMGSNTNGLRDFYDLVGATRMIEIKFLGYQKEEPPKHESETDLLRRILAIRNDLLFKNNYPSSIHSSPASVLCDLHLPIVLRSRAQEVEKKKRVTRKSPSKLGKKTIKKNTMNLLDSVKKNFGENNIEYYLNSAIKIKDTKKRKLIDSAECGDEESVSSEDDDNDNLALNDIQNDERVLEMVSKIPSKYIIFEKDDKKNVLDLFKIITDVAEEREYADCNVIAASTTEKILGKINYYSTIKARDVLRWYSVKDKITVKSGPKINSEFVSEVWGNLVLCILENKINEVNLFQHHSTYLFYAIMY